VGDSNISGRRSFVIVLVVILVASIVLGSYAVYTEIERDSYETVWSYSNEGSSSYDIIMSDAEGNIYALESNENPLDGRHFNYHVAIDPNGTLLWRFPVNAEPGLTIGPDGGYYYVDWQDISFGQDHSQAIWCNITVLNHDGTMRWGYVADNGTLEILGISDQGGVVARHTEQFFNITTNMTEWTETVLSLSSQGELLWDEDTPDDTFVTSAQYAENGTIELFADVYETDWHYLIGMGVEGETLYQVATSPYFPVYDWTGRDGDNSYMVWRTTTAPHTEVVKVCANDLTDGSLRWETVIWEDKGSDEPYPSEHSGGQGTLVDSDGIIYAGDMNGELFALDRNGTVLWHRDSMGPLYGCFPSGGVLEGDGLSFQRIDGESDVDWSIDDLYHEDPYYSKIIITQNDTMVLVHEGAVTEVTVHSEPQFSRSAAVFLALTLVVVAVVVTILYLGVRKGKG